MGKENDGVFSPSRDAYRKKLIEAFNMNRGRILAFKRKPPTPVNIFEGGSLSPKPKKSRPQIPEVMYPRTLLFMCPIYDSVLESTMGHYVVIVSNLMYLK